MLRALVQNWWLFVVQGALAVLFGLMAFNWPGLTLEVLVGLFGAYVLIDGVVALARTFRAAGLGVPWWPFLLQGIAGIAAGVVTFVYPGVTTLVLLYCIAAWALATGVFEIAAAIMLRKELEGEWLLVVSGLLSVVLGLWMIAVPGAGALAVVWLIGSYAIVFGVVLISAGIRLQGLQERLQHAQRLASGES